MKNKNGYDMSKFVQMPEKDPRIIELRAENAKLREALSFYADPDNWKDVWKEKGQESPDFKYFYMLRQRTDDFEKLNEPYHFYAGKRARAALGKDEK